MRGDEDLQAEAGRLFRKTPTGQTESGPLSPEELAEIDRLYPVKVPIDLGCGFRVPECPAPRGTPPTPEEEAELARLYPVKRPSTADRQAGTDRPGHHRRGAYGGRSTAGLTPRIVARYPVKNSMTLEPLDDETQQNERLEAILDQALADEVIGPLDAEEAVCVALLRENESLSGPLAKQLAAEFIRNGRDIHVVVSAGGHQLHYAGGDPFDRQAETFVDPIVSLLPGKVAPLTPEQRYEGEKNLARLLIIAHDEGVPAAMAERDKIAAAKRAAKVKDQGSSPE